LKYRDGQIGRAKSRGVYQGRHEFDGKLPDWSPAGMQREIDRLRAERAKSLAFDVATLDQRQRFERDYAVAVIDGRLFWLTPAEWPFRNPFYYTNSLDPKVRGPYFFAAGVGWRLFFRAASIRHRIAPPVTRPVRRVT
jgi:hypothetical protein